MKLITAKKCNNKTTAKKTLPNQPKLSNQLEVLRHGYINPFFPDAFSADYMYIQVCPISSEYETKFEGEVTSLFIVDSGYSLVKITSNFHGVPYKYSRILKKMDP